MSTKHGLPESTPRMRTSSWIGLVAILLVAILPGSVLLLYLAAGWDSYGYVLVPLVIGFALAYFAPGPIWLRVLITVVVLVSVFAILLTLGIGGLLCASILLTLAVFPVAIGLAVAISVRRLLEKKKRNPRACFRRTSNRRPSARYRSWNFPPPKCGVAFFSTKTGGMSARSS